MDTKALIEDDVYQALKETFLHSGKGRPKKLPVDLVINNKMLVQLYHLVQEGKKSREVINLWLASINPQVADMRVNEFHFWHMACSKEKYLRSLPATDVDAFLKTTCSLEFISSTLSEFGVTKATFSAPPKEVSSPPMQVPNRFVIEVEQFRIAHNFPKSLSAEWLMKLCSCEINYPYSIIDKVMKKYDKLRKAKNRNPSEYNEFLIEKFDCEVKKKPESAPTNICDKCSVREKLHSTKVKEIMRLNKVRKDEAEVANALLLKEQCKNEDLLNQLELITILHGSCDEKVKELNKVKANCKCDKINQSHCATVRKIKNQHAMRERNLLTELEIEKKKKSMLREKISTLKNQNKFLRNENGEAQIKLQKQMSNSPASIPIKGEKDNVYSDGMRKVVIALQSECGVSAANVSKVIEIVSKELFDYVFIDKLPCKQSCVNMCDEGYALSQLQIVENVLRSKNVTLHSDGTSRDNKKIVGHQISLDNGDILCLGFVPVAGEDAGTLLDITINILRQLCQTYCELNQSDLDINTVFKDIVKISSLMTDRAACMKLFDRKFQEFLSSQIGRQIHVKFLHCNAHFLLGLSSEVEKAMCVSEEILNSETCHQLGRDLDDRFNRFSNTSESATNRVIRTVCDILGPRGDQKNGCRVEWTTYCENSIIPSFKGNRFNCYFAAAAAIIFHLEKMNAFFNSGILHESPIFKIQSVALDLKDSSLMCSVCSVAIFYLKVTGPYWKLVNSPSIKYYDFHVYVKMMYDSFKTWSLNPDVLFDPLFTSVFNNELCIKSNAYNAVHEFVSNNDRLLIAKCLQKISERALSVTERQLSDFLEGEFVNVDENTKEILSHCPLTNLIGERCFGEFDFDMSKRRNATLHNRSALHCVSRNKTIKFLNKKHELSIERLFKAARKRSGVLRKENRNLEKEVKNAVRAKFIVNQQKKNDKEIEDIRKRVDISEKVKKHRGPCESCEEIDELMERLKSKSKRQAVEIIKNEIRYHKIVLGRKNLKFGTLEEMVASLQNILSSAGPAAKRPRLR